MIKIKQNNFFKKIDSYFQFSNRNATIKKEIIGALSTFLAMMYILAVNPAILAEANGLNNTLNAEAGIFLGTALSAFIATFLMGLFTNVPLALAPGMGINAFFTYTVASQENFGLDYYQALVCVFISGLVYAAIAITPARKIIIELIPKNLKCILAIVIGFFLCVAGLRNIGVTNINYNAYNFNYPLIIIGFIGTIITIVLYFINVKNSIIITTILTLIMLLITWGVDNNITKIDNIQAFALRSFNDFSSFGLMINNFFAYEHWLAALANPVSYVAIFTFLYIDFFDTTSTIIAIGRSSNLIPDINDKKSNNLLKKANYIDASGTILGAILLNSSITVYSESQAGISFGAKTGISSIIIALMFLLSLLLWPIMGPFMPIGPYHPVTGHAVFLTGILMIMQIKHLDFQQYLDIPILIFSSLAAIITFSIPNGISWAIILYVLLYESHALWLLMENKKQQKKATIKHVNWFFIILLILSFSFIIFDILAKTKIFSNFII